MGLCSASYAAENSQFTIGHARFTVVTPLLIRLEYSPSATFVDAPSWLAVNREARFDGAKVEQTGNRLTIDTGNIHLQFADDGKPFSPSNLSADIRRGQNNVTWHPGDTSSGNLGGTLRTLDGSRGAVSLGEGVLSRDGWYLLDDSKSPLFTTDWVQARPKNDNTDWYLFGYGTDYPAALKSLTAIGGSVPMPRKYTLGIWYSRYWSFTADAFKQIVDEYEQHGFPLDTMVMDMGWHLSSAPPELSKKVDLWTGFTWDKNLIPDPAGLLKWMHEHGLHVTLNDHPAAGVQPHEAMYADFMRAMGEDPATQKTIPFDAGNKKYLDTFYAYTHDPHIREGVDFWWLDWQQYPHTRSIPEIENLQLLNWYNYHHTETDNQRGVSFSRWAGWGDHRYPIHFSGDADTGWSMLAFEVPFTSTAGNVGCFFWSHDIGGHQGGRNEESYARWCQFGAMSAALRSHSTRDPLTDRRPWNYPKWAEDSMRVSFRLRSVLMPYLYTAIHQATADSMPFIRPLYLDHPTIEAAYHNSQEYRFGDNLLVAPIATPGVGPNRVAAQAVWFPPAHDGSEVDWFDYFTGEQFASGESAVATAPIDQFPLYVRGGMPIPMQPYTSRPATAQLNTLVVRCYPGRDSIVGNSQVYEDDGDTNAYTHGEQAITPLSYVRHGDKVTVTVEPTAGKYATLPAQRSIIIELPNTQPGATADAGKVSYDEKANLTRIELPAAAPSVKQTITVTVQQTPPAQIVAAATANRLQQLLGQPLDAYKASHPQIEPAMARLIAAVQGVAVLGVNQHPYGFGDDVAFLYLHNHHTAPEKLTLADPQPHPADATPGQPLFATHVQSPHALKIARPAVLSDFPDGVSSLSVDRIESLPPADNLATRATATASTGNGHSAIDSSTEGFPGNQSFEWVTTKEHNGAWLKLEWPQPTRMNRVLLYDRPNADDQVLAGTLTFSDGTTVDVGPLPNNGQLPGIVTFPEKTCTWVKFTVTHAGENTRNIGLSEMAVTDN